VGLARHRRDGKNCLRLAARHGARSGQLLPAQQSPPQPGGPADGEIAKEKQTLRTGAAPG